MRFARFAIIALFLLLANLAVQAATLMPPGKIQFLDANGAPLASGTVTFYVPNTTTLKNTWQDSGATILNTNPVVLDSGGYAIIYGSGNYRQLVKDADGNTVWDQLTASTSEVTVDNIQYYASSVGGAANAITVSAITPSDYSLTVGKTLRFISPLSNTGSTTLNPISLGATTIKRVTTTAGTVNLAGGEIISGGVYDVLYDGTQYILLNPSVTDNPGDMKPFLGATVPNGYLLAYPQTLSRTTYAPLFAAIGTVCGSGDGSTTFNLCDLRGRAAFGKDDMGGSAASRITNGVSSIVGTTLGASGGDQALQQHLHTAATTITDPGHNHTQDAHTHASGSYVYNLPTNINIGTTGGVGGANFNAWTSFVSFTLTSTALSGTSGSTTATNQSATTGVSATTTTSNTGAGNSQNMPPTFIVNFIVRL